MNVTVIDVHDKIPGFQKKIKYVEQESLKRNNTNYQKFGDSKISKINNKIYDLGVEICRLEKQF